MRRGQRRLAAAVLAMLLAPSAAMIWAPYRTRSVAEHRMLAAPPAEPRRAADWTALPRRADAWFSDHFAGRERLVRTAFALQAVAGLRPAGGLQVVQGRGDWLLLYSGLLGATGGEVDDEAARRYGAFACSLQAEAKARGARFLFAPAPSTAEIYPEALPDWVPRGSPTQPERVLQAARGCGVQPLDLRPAMLAAKAGARLYQHHDSHWTNAGALVAFNAIAGALGEPWVLDPRSMDWRPGRPADSDLVRLSGFAGLPQELAPEPPGGPDLAPETGRLKALQVGPYPAPFVQPARAPRPMVLVIGDSYAADFMGQYFRRAGVSWAWAHQADCRFDRRILDRVRPDVVVLSPVSRLESCR